MAIKHWHITERPREKLLNHGVASLSDAELLALFLQSGTAGRSAVDVAHEALNHFGSLGKLMCSEKSAVYAFKGFGKARYALLQAAMEVSRRHMLETIQTTDVLSSPQDVRNYLSLNLAGLQHEVFAALFLDNRHRVINYQELFRG